MFRSQSPRALPRVLGPAIGLFATSVVTSTAFAAAGDASRGGERGRKAQAPAPVQSPPSPYRAAFPAST